MNWCNRVRLVLPTRRPKVFYPSSAISTPRSRSMMALPKIMDPKQKVEEETLPFYNPADYYPVRLREVFQSRYKTVAKLGYGVHSTVWLCDDLKQKRFLTLKIRTRTTERDAVCLHDDHEIMVSKHLEDSLIEHGGRHAVRRVLDAFEISGPHGTHRCLLYEPLLWSFTECMSLLSNKRLSPKFAQQSMQLILIALDYLHSCGVTHTDLNPNNILFKLQDESILSQVALDEEERPYAIMLRPDRTIYVSRILPPKIGEPVICDLGEARINDGEGGGKHRGLVMPRVMRAPEVILGMDWNHNVDVWSVATTMWHFIQGRTLFSTGQEGKDGDEEHLAEMVSLLGNPPKHFLERSQRSTDFWDREGNWVGSVPVPDQSFESRANALDGESKALFTQFMRRILCWVPEERPTLLEIGYDDFLMQHVPRS